MAKFDNPLNNIKIASPCSADWDAMVGTERKRYCGECKLNVYNFSGMTRDEAENILLNSEGRLCVRFYRRADGTVLTEDCPVGWAKVKRRAANLAKAFASLVFGLSGSIGLMNYFGQPDKNKRTTETKTLETREATAIRDDLKFNANYAAMGNISIPPKNSDYGFSNGGMTNLNEVQTQIKNRRRR